MSERFQTDNRELDDLFERYRAAPESHVFAPLADACRKAGMLDEALEICKKGVARSPRYASGHVVLGKCHYDSGRAAEAQASFDHVLELDPKNLVALKYLGIIHAERGDMVRAREYFEHILAMDPGDRDIRSRIEDVSQRPAVGRSTRVPPVAAPKPPAVVTPPAPAPVVPPVAETAVPAVAAVEKPADEDEPVLLPDVADEEFRGEPITLRDESVTPDEIATITLADIYASQGYTTRALRIYREVHRRQPSNAGLAAKIAALEKQEAASKPAVRPAAAKPEPAKKTDTTKKPEPARPRAAEPPAPPATGAAPGANSIDQARSYEHFKRWIKSSR
ncbi:MAG TPA: tetratricopeptide repeat protein [Candidatus Krumholzibacteria bacterium]